MEIRTRNNFRRPLYAHASLFTARETHVSDLDADEMLCRVNLIGAALDDEPLLVGIRLVVATELDVRARLGVDLRAHGRAMPRAPTCLIVSPPRPMTRPVLFAGTCM